MAVHRGAHEDQLQVRPPHHHVFQDGQQEVRLDAALVNLRRRRDSSSPLAGFFKDGGRAGSAYLVHDDVGQGAEVPVVLELPQQDSGGTVEEAGPLPRQVLHPDLVSTQR